MTEKKPAFIATLLTGFAAFCAAQSKPAAKVACAQVKIVVADNAATPTTSAVRFDEFGRTGSTGTAGKGSKKDRPHILQFVNSWAPMLRRSWWSIIRRDSGLTPK